MAFGINPFSAYRQGNILGGGPYGINPGRLQISRNPFDLEAEQEPTPRPRSYEDDISDLMTNMGPGLQAYKAYLGRMPMRQNYKPNWMTRIGAALSGASAGLKNPGEGVQIAQAINESPYRTAMEDYMNEGAGLKAQAQLEQDELDSKVRALQNARAMGLKYNEFALKQAESMSKMRNDTTTANAAMTRATAYAENLKRRGYDASPQADGSVLYIDKNDPSKTVRVPANTVQAGQLRVSQGQLGVSRGQLGVAQQNAQTNRMRAHTYEEATRDADRRGMMGLGVRMQGQIPSPNEQQTAQDMALREMMSDPMFSDYISLDANGYPVVSKDDDSEDYKDFFDALDAKVSDILTGKNRRGRR